MILMVEKGFRGVICYSVNRYAKANNKYMKDFDKNEELSYLKYWDLNNLYGRAMQQKLPVDFFEWVEDISEFHEKFIKRYNEKRDEGYFFGVDDQYPEALHDLHEDLPFLLERMKIEKVEKLVANLNDKIKYVKICYLN